MKTRAKDASQNSEIGSWATENYLSSYLSTSNPAIGSAFVNVENDDTGTGGTDALGRVLLGTRAEITGNWAKITLDSRIVSGSPVDSTILIESTGATTVSASQLLVPNGTAGLPSIAFDSDTNTGLYRVAENEIGFSTAGALRLTLSGNVLAGAAAGSLALENINEVQTADGGPTDPSYTFTNDLDTGMYLDGTGSLAWAAGGVEVMQVGSSNLNFGAAVTGRPSIVHADNGSATAAQYTFAGDGNTGLRRAAADEMELIAGGSRVLYLDGTGTKAFFAPGIYDSTTGSAANVNVLDTNGITRRSTSSLRYKRDVEPISAEHRRNVIDRTEGIWFRPKDTPGSTDNPDHSFYGFAAEHIAEIDPRLCHWVTEESCNGCSDWSHQQRDLHSPEKAARLISKALPHVAHTAECMRPDGVQYDRFVPFLIDEVKELRAQLQALTTGKEIL